MPHYATLTNGQDVELNFHHIYDDEKQPTETQVQLRIADQEGSFEESDVLKAHTVLHPNDQFCRETGRKFALRNLFNKHRGLFSYEDRTILWNLTLPKYGILPAQAQADGRKPTLLRRMFRLV